MYQPAFCFYFQEYLVQFGYLNPRVMTGDSSMTDDMMENMMRTSITDFQMFFGLEPTGKYRFMLDLRFSQRRV
jgi:hypothetical protein